MDFSYGENKQSDQLEFAGPDMYPAAVNPYPSYGENAESNHVEFSGATNASS